MALAYPYPIRIVVFSANAHELQALFSAHSSEFQIIVATSFENVYAVSQDKQCHVALLSYEFIRKIYGPKNILYQLHRDLGATSCILLCEPSEMIREIDSAQDLGMRLVHVSRKSLRELPDKIRNAVNSNRSPFLQYSPRPSGREMGSLSDTSMPDAEVHWVLSHLFPETKELKYEIIKKGKNSAVLWAWQDGFESVDLVKLGPRGKISEEVAHYRDFVERYSSSTFYALLKNKGFSAWNFGGIIYTLRSSEIGSITFSEFYKRVSPKEIRQVYSALRHLFGKILRDFHRKRKRLDGELYAAYNKYLDLDKRLAHLPVPNVGFGLPDPVSWVLSNRQMSNLTKHGAEIYESLTHGDLWGENILVHQGGAEPDDTPRCWIVDYERTGWGHAFRDFAELEVDILTRLAKVPADNLFLFYKLIVGLVDPTWIQQYPSRLIETVIDNDIVDTVFKVILELRRWAGKAPDDSGDPIDAREYYWALLLEALFVTTLPSVTDLQRDRANIMAAVLCGRLDGWRGDDWLPSHWPEVRWIKSVQDPLDFPSGSVGNTSQKDIGGAMLPEQQAALTVLTEATKFLFAELGRRLEFWRQKKGEKAAAPQIIELMQGPVTVIRLDDIEQAVNLSVLQRTRERVATSLDILIKLNREKDGHRKELRTNTLLEPPQKAWLNNRLADLEKDIGEEANHLQELLDRVYTQ